MRKGHFRDRTWLFQTDVQKSSDAVKRSSRFSLSLLREIEPERVGKQRNAKNQAENQGDR